MESYTCVYGAWMPPGISQGAPRRRMGYITAPLDCVTAVVQYGVDINLDLSLRQDDRFVVAADSCIASATDAPEATHWPRLQMDPLNSRTLSTRTYLCADALKAAPQPSCSTHPEERAQFLNQRLLQAGSEAFPVAESDTRRQGRRTWISE
eukprot:1370386-Pyramimonas_sp.AAC.1